MTLLALALLLVEGRAELTAHPVNLQACSASTTRWWKETATDRVVDAGNRGAGGSLCLDTWNDAAGTVKACSCDHAGTNPSGQKIAWWRNDSSLRWLSAPGGSAGGMLCLVQLGTSHSVSLAPCGTGLVSNASAQWQWPSAENTSSAKPIQNRRSQLCLNVVTKSLPPPPPGPALPSIPGAPTWEPNWNLTETMATYIEPRGPSPSWANLSHVYGLVGLDWLNANGIWWDQTPAGRNRTRCEAVSVENCRRLKAAGLAKRCMIYHNLELALEWEESQRSVMYDQRKASYFLRYNNGTIYQEDINFGDQYFWNHTNINASNYFVSSVVGSLSDSAVDGTFTDDESGVPQEHPKVAGAIGMSPAQLSELQRSTRSTHTRLLDALIKAGKYNWQAFGGGSYSRATCGKFMAEWCRPGMQNRSLQMQTTYATNDSIAAFLIARPKIAYIAAHYVLPHGKVRAWLCLRDDNALRPLQELSRSRYYTPVRSTESESSEFRSQGPFEESLFMLQPGTPQGDCVRDASGRYSRVWTNGKAVLDCTTGLSELPFPTLRG